MSAFMGEVLPGLTHGKQVDGKTQVFEQEDFIGDKGLGNSGITLEDHS